MEITLFRRNEIDQHIFCSQVPFKEKNYTNASELKNCYFGNFCDLDKAKGLIDLLDKNLERHRRAAAKYLHEYEIVKILCKKQVISRAYFKLYEIMYHEPIIVKETLHCFFICEAPGGFIEAVCDIRRKKNLQTKYITVSKYDRYIKYDRYLEELNILYSDITEPENLQKTINTVLSRYPSGLDFITADGGFEIKLFNAQEILSAKLLLCEIYLAISTQKINGTFVIKFFDMFSHNRNVYYFLLSSMYEYTKIIKPKTSRNCNSERYIVCYNFKGCSENLRLHLLNIILNFKISDSITTLVFPEFDFSKYPIFIKKISTFNNLVLYEQIKTIHESIKMITSKNMYIQNLILSLFLEKNKRTIHIYQNLVHYKHILQSRIKKCIDFLRIYNINMIPITT